MTQKEQLIQVLSCNNITVNDLQAEQLIKYYEMLVEKNKVMNLTAITEFDDVIVKHFADSLVINKVIKLNSQKVIDVGTGAGFPGIPLKILYPDIKLTLLDSLNKRLVFLNEVIEELGLKNVTTVHARAEEGARMKEHREKYDVAVSRAVANLSTLVEYCLPYVAVDGSFISYKGDKASDELSAARNAIKLLGGKTDKCEEFILDGTDINRSLIKIDKVGSTSNTYPRSGGKPSSSPLS